MCRTCYLTGHTEEITEFYKVGQEIDTYRTPAELVDKAQFYLANPDAAEKLREAGFRRVFLGIETPVEESLKEAQKSQNRGNLLESVKKIQSYGMEVMAGFIVGFDHDPEDIFERQIAFIRGVAHGGDPERPIAHSAATFMLGS